MAKKNNPKPPASGKPFFLIDTKGEEDGNISPKPPDIFREILWVLRYGKKWWWLLLLAALVLLLLYILPKLNLKYQNIYPKAETSGNSSSAINTLGLDLLIE